MPFEKLRLQKIKHITHGHLAQVLASFSLALVACVFAALENMTSVAQSFCRRKVPEEHKINISYMTNI